MRTLTSKTLLCGEIGKKPGSSYSRTADSLQNVAAQRIQARSTTLKTATEMLPQRFAFGLGWSTFRCVAGSRCMSGSKQSKLSGRWSGGASQAATRDRRR